MGRINPKIPWLFPAVLILLLLCGCWDHKELNRVAFVAGSGLDRDPSGRVILTVQVIRPGEIKRAGGVTGSERGTSDGTAKGAAVRVTSSTGKTTCEAVKNITTQTNRWLSFSHSQIIVIGKNAAQKGVYSLLEYFIRTPQPRPTVLLMIAEGKASDVLRSYDGIEKVDALGFAMAARTSGENAYAPTITLHEFTQRLMSKTAAPLAPIVELYEEKGFAEEKTKRGRILGTAVFRGDRLVGKLGLRETQGLLWVLGKVKDGTLTLPYSGSNISLEIKENKCKLTPLLQNGQLTMKNRGQGAKQAGRPKRCPDPPSPTENCRIGKKTK